MPRLVLAAALVLAACAPDPVTPTTLATFCSEPYDEQRIYVQAVVDLTPSGGIGCWTRGRETRCEMPLVEAAGDSALATLQILDADGPNTMTIDPGETDILAEIYEGTSLEGRASPSDGRPGSITLRDYQGEGRVLPTRAGLTGTLDYVAWSDKPGGFCRLEVDDVEWID